MSLSIYSSSAGSGKTYTLAREYISLILNKPELANQVLAVTFTNKATAEMKERVIRFLYELSKGRNEALAQHLAQSSKSTGDKVGQQAARALKFLLHHYSDLRIMTIDKFFQQVVRSFARDFDLSPGYTLELDIAKVIDHALSAMYGQIATHAQLRKWLEHIVEDQIEQGKNWNFRQNLAAFAQEVFKEKYQTLEWNTTEESLGELHGSLLSIIKWFEQGLNSRALILNPLIEQGRAHKDYLADKSKNPALSIASKLVQGDFSFTGQKGYQKIVDPGYAILKVGASPEAIRWEAEFMPLFRDLMSFFESNLDLYTSCLQVKSNFAQLAISRLMNEEVKRYKQQNDVFLLAEAQVFLNRLMGDNDASFIFEKVGNQTRHFLIDEFQDTSTGQWKNFLPLLQNSLGQNHHNLLVGDVKQSIYRFRGGDLRLLLKQAEDDVKPFEADKKHLQTNWRSKQNIVDFNNEVFRLLPQCYEQNLEKDSIYCDGLIQSAYQDAHQECADRDDEYKGFVRLSFPEKPEDKSIDDVIAEGFIEQIRRLQDLGFQPAQLAVLVDRNKDGAKVASWLANAGDEDHSGRYSYQFISSDSLLVASSIAVQALSAGLRFVANEQDFFSFRQYLVCLQKLTKQPETANYFLTLEQALLQNQQASLLQVFSTMRRKTLTDVLAQLLQVSGIAIQQSDLQFVQIFTDQAYRFAAKESNDLHGFLKWWQSASDSLKLTAPEGTNAINIITVHKSKGLEFDVVLMPFAGLPVAKPGIHASYLWTTSDQKPFSAHEPVCVKSGKALVNSYFSGEYAQERINEALDSINKVYVAFTRARLGFIGWFKQTKGGKNVGDFIKQLIEEESFNLNALFDETTSWWQLGEVEFHAGAGKSGKQVQVLDQFPIAVGEHKLRTTPAPDNARQAERDIGIAFHKIMSSILKTADWQQLEQQCDPEIKSLVEATLNISELQPLFDGSWKVRNERTLMLPGGNTKRPDRWQTKNGEHVLLDFKTGSPNPNDEKQVQTYVQTHIEAGFKQVRGYLVYPAEEKLVKV